MISESLRKNGYNAIHNANCNFINYKGIHHHRSSKCWGLKSELENFLLNSVFSKGTRTPTLETIAGCQGQRKLCGFEGILQ